MKPHKHAELIKAWADGAEIEIRTQYSNGSWSGWEFFKEPRWGICDADYRIKPEPKSDVVRYCYVHESYGYSEADYLIKMDSPNYGNKDNYIQIIFDSETGKPKSAEVLK